MKPRITARFTAAALLALGGACAMIAATEDDAAQFEVAPALNGSDEEAPTLSEARLVTSFTYQGRLREDGLPANGNYDMTFQLSNAPVLGLLLQQIDINNVAVVDGLFTVELAFNASHFNGNDRWMRIEVEGQGLSPRHHILPTPYAITADTLEVPASLSGSGSVFTSTSTDGAGVTGLHSNSTGVSAGVVGTTNSRADNAQGVLGFVNSTSPGAFSAGVRGINNGTGGLGTGMYGSHGGNGWGVYGVAPSGRGVYGFSTSGEGVVGHSTSGIGMQGTTASTASSAAGVFGRIDSNSPGALSKGVYGLNNGLGGLGIGVHGQHAGNGWGVYGQSEGGRAVYGNSSSGAGVRGFSTSGTAIQAATTAGDIALTADNANFDTYAELANENYGVFGQNSEADAIGTGVHGLGGSTGVYGTTTSTGFGTRTGVHGYASGSQSGINQARGVYGFAFANFFDGNREAYGVLGAASSGGDGGGTNRAYGVYGDAAGGTGTNWAGYFDGAVHIVGTLSKGAGAFKIDHPLDPENKYLIHSFVESPDMMNIYNGVATLDDTGMATVDLPDYFEALNRDYRYQLTALGAPMPDLYIAQEVSGNSFVIGGGEPGKRVSWEVTGIRQDAYANANRLVNEVDKTGDERGRLMHPEAYGRPWEEGIQGHRMKDTRREQMQYRQKDGDQ